MSVRLDTTRIKMEVSKMIINDTNCKENKKPNASQITHGLAQLGGGSKKDGGSGMMGGMQNILLTGVEIGNRISIDDQETKNGLLDAPEDE